MRIWIGRALLLLGAFALVAAGVAAFWAGDAAKRTPLNIDTTTVLDGTAEGMLAKSDTPVPIAYVNQTKADPDASDDDVVAFVEQSCINVDRDNPPTCLPASDPRLVTNSVEGFAVDRRTAEAVKDQSAYIKGSTTPYAGLINKLPFDAKKKDYPYWNGTLGHAVTLSYVGEKKIHGLTTYRYDMEVPTTDDVVLAKAEKPGEKDTIGSYAATQSIWVDPKTGAFIDQHGTQTMTLPDGTVVVHVEAAYTDATIAHNVDTAKSNGRMLLLVTRVLPIGGLVLGLVLLGLGAWLVITARRTKRVVARPASPTAPAAA